jgi:integrase
MARKIDRLNQLRAAAETMPPDLARYVETMSPSIRETLARWGILSASRVAASRPLEDHLGDYEAFLTSQGRKPRYLSQAVGQVRRVVNHCGWRFWSDISPSGLVGFINGLKEGKDPAADRTANGYLTAVKSFCSWMVRERRASESPLSHLRKRNESPKNSRRPFTLDEARRLIQSASDGPLCHGMIGPDRALVYRLAMKPGCGPESSRR